jgi:hypothetical protein
MAMSLGIGIGLPFGGAAAAADNGPSTPTTSTLLKSMDLGPRNGEDGIWRKINGPNLTNLFGNGTTAADGAIGIRVLIDKGSLYVASGGGASANPFNVTACIFSASSVANMSLFYYGPDRTDTNATGQALANRYRFRITGAGAVAVDVRSAADHRNEPITLRMWNSGTTFRLDIIRLDGTIVAGDAIDYPTWVGAASQTTFKFAADRATPTSLSHAFSGEISEFIQLSSYTNVDADWQNFAKGALATAAFDNAKIVQYYAMQGASDLARTYPAAGTALTLSREVGAADNLTLMDGPPLCGSWNGTKGLVQHLLPNGYLAGVPFDDLDAPQDLPVSFTNTGGGATHVQARAVKISDGTVVKGWTRVTASQLADNTRLDTVLPAVAGATSGWLRVETRREDDVEIRTAGRHCGVGVKMVVGGQSQIEILNLKRPDASASALLAASAGVASPNFSYVTVRGSATYRRAVDGDIVRARAQVSSGVAAEAQVLAALHPTRLFQQLMIAVQGTNIADYYQNLERAPAASPGTGPYGDGSTYLATADYFLWGDGATLGTGVVTDVIRTACQDPDGEVDITLVDYMPSYSDRSDRATLGGKLARLMTGVDWSVHTGLPAGYFTEFTLRHPLHLAVGIHDRVRHSFDYQAEAIETFRSQAHEFAYYSYQAGIGSYSGFTAHTRHWTPTKYLERPAEAGHQSFNAAEGNRRLGADRTHGLLGVLGLSTVAPVFHAGTATLGGGGTTITLPVTVPAGGTLTTVDGGSGVATTLYEVSTDSGATWASTGFTAAVSGSDIVLTKSSGNWTLSGLRVRPMWGGPLARDAVDAANATLFDADATNAANFAAEHTEIGDLPVVTHADLTTAGILPGVPLHPVMTTTGVLTVA